MLGWLEGPIKLDAYGCVGIIGGLRVITAQGIFKPSPVGRLQFTIWVVVKIMGSFGIPIMIRHL